jgi:hypothetical protein
LTECLLADIQDLPKARYYLNLRIMWPCSRRDRSF